jgi:hypothetical protein
MANEFTHKDPGTSLTQDEYISTSGCGHIFACQATGDIIYADSTTVLKKLARGTTTQLLQVASCKPAWTSTPSLGSTSWTNMNHAHAASNSGGTLTTVGVLNAGSITCGFGTIDTGSSTITTTGTITGGAFTTGGAVTAGAASTISIDADSEFIGLKLTNQSDSANTCGFVTLAFDLEDTGGTAVDAGKISIKKEASFTATASTQDSKMEFQLSENGTLSEKMTLSSAGALSIDGALSIGGSQVLSGSALASAVKLNNANWTACGTDLSVANGGTGVSTLTANGALIGNGTSAIASVDMSTKGGLLVGDGSGNPSVLAVGGTANHVLTVDSSVTNGMKWAAVSGLGVAAVMARALPLGSEIISR